MLGLYPVVLVDFFSFFLEKKKKKFYALYSVATLFFLWPLCGLIYKLSLV